MCRDKRSDDNTPLDNLSFPDHEDDDTIEENNSSVTHKITRSVLVAHINSLAVEPTNEAFITPIMALKVVDFIHLLNHRTAISFEAADNLIHKWYKVSSGEKVVTTFNQRTKSMDEMLQLLKADCGLDNVMID